MAEMIEQIRQRNELREKIIHLKKFKDSDPVALRSYKEAIGQMNHINAKAAEWSNQVVKMIFSLRDHPQGTEFIQKFWSIFENLADGFHFEGRTEARKTKSGILGVITTIQILDSMGYECYFAWGDQDAIEKIDLWAKKGDEMVALQIKSHATGELRAVGEEITHEQSTVGLRPEDRRTVNARNLLLQKSNKYAIKWNTAVIPFWVELSRSYKPNMVQDETTGFAKSKGDFEQAFVRPLLYAMRKGTIQ
jgi:hypothetical protein